MVSSQEVLATIPKITGGLSFLFSLATASYIIFFGEDAKQGFYNRLVIGMCFAGMLSSLACFMSTWPMPADSGAVFAVGNEATCRIQGFFQQYSIAAQLYVTSMGAFYLLAIKYGWKERHFARWGPLFHIVPVGFGLGTSIFITAYDIVGPANLWCWIAPQEDRPDLDVNPYRMTLFYAPLWFAMSFVGVNLAFVFLYVHNVTKVAEGNVAKWMPANSVRIRNVSQDADKNGEDEIYCGEEMSSVCAEEKSSTFVEESLSSAPTVDADPHDKASTKIRKKQEEQIKTYARRRREIAHQCLRYALAFYVTWTPLSCVRLLQLFEKPVPYGLLVLAATMTPLQGLPNLIAFLYPMIRKKWKHKRNRKQPRSKDAIKPSTHTPAQRPEVNDEKSPTGIHGSSAWNIAMGQQSKHELDPNNFDLSLNSQDSEDKKYTNPGLYLMTKK